LPQVIDVAVQRLPALADAAISHAWAGLYEVTPDANPIIGPAPGVDGLFLETHDNPAAALSDGANALSLSQLPALLKPMKQLSALVRSWGES
jgi:3-deoxy-D-arabino-heptulosonate 7-phosphate (DAHP) synthase